MKNMATAIHTIRQNITIIQRTAYFRCDGRARPSMMRSRSWLSSFIRCSAWCFMIVTDKPILSGRQTRSGRGSQGGIFYKTKSYSLGFSLLDAAPHGMESCPEWEPYKFFLTQNWIIPPIFTQYSANIGRPRVERDILFFRDLGQAVR